MGRDVAEMKIRRQPAGGVRVRMASQPGVIGQLVVQELAQNPAGGFGSAPQRPGLDLVINGQAGQKPGPAAEKGSRLGPASPYLTGQGYDI